MTWREGQDGTSPPLYREHLRAPWWLWAVAGIFVVSMGAAYGYALGPVAAAVAAGLVAAGVAAVLLSAGTIVQVDDRVVRAGRARLPLTATGTVETLDAEASALARTRHFNPAAYSLLRTWATSTSVRIEQTDPHDPHPYWLISSRNPAALAAAIERARLGEAPGQAQPERAG